VCERERERERERESRWNLLILEIKLQIFILTAFYHAGQTLKILHRFTIESKNL